MKSFIQQRILESVATKNKLLTDEQLLQTVEQASRTILEALKQDNKILFCGNGGSAADAQHLAAEFSGRFYMNRKALPAEALHCNTSYLTAVANDYSFDVIYSRLIQGIGIKGDVLIGLSTSGNSKNIIAAFKVAREAGITTIAFTGSTGGALKEESDYLINIPSDNTPRIQESHIMVGHIICEWVEQAYFQ